jgi:hypothetical protein
MTNKQVREWYINQVSQIPLRNEEWLKEGINAQERARRAWQIRHQARLQARKLMENPREVEHLRGRDQKKYGNPEGPTFQYLVDQATEAGLKGDNIYEVIIRGSLTTNEGVNKRFED